VSWPALTDPIRSSAADGMVSVCPVPADPANQLVSDVLVAHDERRVDERHPGEEADRRSGT
jgi:hypothetical protein